MITFVISKSIPSQPAIAILLLTHTIRYD